MEPTLDSPVRVLLTAFEPSGDDHASSVIAELRARHPDLRIDALGGPKMERAGANLIERTGQDAVMGLPGLGKILEHRRINKRIARWAAEQVEAGEPVTVHVPVDSPAANWAMCKIMKAHGTKVVHLVAPQMWAWGSWRIKRLRKWSNLVLCLLPFEESWFQQRGVAAKFIGHPLFDKPLDLDDLARRASELPEGEPKIALMPGSRPGELASSWGILLDAFRRIRKDFPEAAGVVAATTDEVGADLRRAAEDYGGWPDGLAIAAAQTDVVVNWCDIALVVSGTVTLQIAKQQKPMVTFYRPNRLVYHLLARWLVATRIYTLPNLILGEKRVPELIPYFDKHGEGLAVEVIRLRRQSNYADDQREALERVVERFKGKRAAASAADAIEEMAGLTSDVKTDDAIGAPE